MNRIINNDCVAGLRTLGSECVALTVTSPPYDKVRDFAPFDFESTSEELYRVTSDGGVVVWVVGDQIVNGSETGTSFHQALHFKEIGFDLRTMVFEPLGQSTSPRYRYGLAVQFMFVLSKGRPRVANFIHDKRNKSAGTYRKPRHLLSRERGWFSCQRPIRVWGRRGNVWNYAVGGGHTTKDKYAFDHPALMPESLAHDHILTWSNPADLVLDPFAGAGTTCKMAALLGRKFIGFEIEKRYCELAERRVRAAIIGGLL
jgi:DNA modification methylase